MRLEVIALIIGVCFGVVTFVVSYTIRQLRAAVPQENRDFLDPLPSTLRILWPLIRFVDYYICSQIPSSWINGQLEKLKVSGLLFLLSPRQFTALSLVSSALFLVTCWAALSLIDSFSFAAGFGAAAVGFIYPRIWLKDVLKKRQKAILRTLPAYLDFLTMGVEAGLNMSGAISQAVTKGPIGPLKSEFSLVLRDLRAGLTRADALRRFEDRIRVPQVSSFVNAVIQAERMGASLGSTFRFQAEQRRTERFQRAEKLAMEAPVKLIFPLVAFIFPITFLVLMFPIVMKYLQSGM
jgi:tight adherence protein C